jgi:hypothetical protein
MSRKTLVFPAIHAEMTAFNSTALRVFPLEELNLPCRLFPAHPSRKHVSFFYTAKHLASGKPK